MINPILCIDDDEVAGYILRVSLHKGGLGPDIQVFKDCEEAIGHLRQLEEKGASLPELIFLDLNMNYMDGWEFLEFFQGAIHPRFPESKIIILTSSLNPEDRARSGMFDFVLDFYEKPVGQDLIRKLKEHSYFSGRFSDN